MVLSRLWPCLHSTLKKLYIATLLIVSACLAGCVSFVPRNQQIPIPSYRATQPVAVLIVDSREYVLDGSYPSSYIGTTIHAFGVHVSRHLYPYLSDSQSDENITLPNFLVERLVQGLMQAGWRAVELKSQPVPDQKSAAALVAPSQSTRLLVIDISEWRSRYDEHSFSRFDFNTAYTVHVFDVDGRPLLKKTTKRNNYYQLSKLAEKHPEATSVRNAVLMLSRDELLKVMDDPDLRSILAAPMGAISAN